MKELSPRQVHLDFHTSEHIPDVAEHFDAKIFAQTVKEASVGSMTVFARCHHGWAYYPSKRYPETIHPSLRNKNLMLEQVSALHDVGIRAPIYITVQWDYLAATTRPEWLVRKKDGAHMGGSFTEPGFYQSLCVNTGYYDYLSASTAEICEMLGEKLDGIFFDIVMDVPCWCSSCLADMKKLGINASNDNEVQAFAKTVIDHFKANMSALVRKHRPNCGVFYNAGHIGPCTKESADAYSHFELESLPSGSWGYLHFPATARYARALGKASMGMTGKFHTEWGDFHSLKNQAALEFECFQMLSYGFACSVGDQLEPAGRLNPATYRLIGNVFKQIASREEWAMPSTGLTEAALITSESHTNRVVPKSILGAVQLLEELALQFDIIDRDMDFSPYPLLILPDDLIVCSDTHKRFNEYVKNGGKILAFGSGGLSETGSYPDCFGVKHMGKRELYPDFLVPSNQMATGLEPENEYVIYLQGEHVTPSEASVILEARAPYFKREKDRFCSHRYTPSAGKATYPAAFKNGNTVLFSHPILLQYRENAPFWCKQLVANALDILLPNRLVRHNGPSTMKVNLLAQPEKNRVCVHLLSYIPVRKSATIDIIEERTRLTNVNLVLHLPNKIKQARLVPEDIMLDIKDGALTVPEVNGYAIVELQYN